MEFGEFISKAKDLQEKGYGNAEVFINDSKLLQHFFVGKTKNCVAYLYIESNTKKKFSLKNITLSSLIESLEAYSRREKNSNNYGIVIKEGTDTELWHEYDITDIIPASNHKDVVIIQYLPNRTSR